MKEVQDNARKLMRGFCRVCRVCDGKACAGEVPGMGGVGTGASFVNNVEGLRSVMLNMKVLHDIKEPDMSTNVLGFDLAMPLMAAPIGGVSFNMGGGIEESEYVDAVLEGCREAGVIGCTGDGAPQFVIDAALEGIKLQSGHGIPFIKPWEGEELDEKIDRAFEAGSKVIGMDVDAAGLTTLKKMGRPVSPKTPDELRVIVKKVHDRGGGFILKGVMDPGEAKIAVDLGVDAVVVSNHGGRVLDHTPSTAEVLPAVAEAVKGRAKVLADGGVRDGVDVFKMISLGADCVLIGRPFCVAAVGGLKQGVIKYIKTVREQFLQAMVLTGSPDVQSIDRASCTVPERW